MTRRLFSSFALAVTAGALSCSGPRASIEIEDARTSWVNLAVNRHIFIDLDVLAHDQLGGPIGQYCASVVIPFQDTAHACANDLSDGDRKTFRIESTGDVGDAAHVSVTLRHEGINIGRDLVGPVTPK
jgi:hypothetical protein